MVRPLALAYIARDYLILMAGSGGGPANNETRFPRPPAKSWGASLVRVDGMKDKFTVAISAFSGSRRRRGACEVLHGCGGAPPSPISLPDARPSRPAFTR